MINLYRKENNKVIKAHEDHIATNTSEADLRVRCSLSSSNFPDWCVQPESRLCGDDWKFVVAMIVYQVGHALKCPISSPETINNDDNWQQHPSHLRTHLTTPSGSTSSRCFLPIPCIPVSTYCPGVCWLSRTRKSPSYRRSSSASFLKINISLLYHLNFNCVITLRWGHGTSLLLPASLSETWPCWAVGEEVEEDPEMVFHLLEDELQMVTCQMDLCVCHGFLDLCSHIRVWNEVLNN